MKKNWFIGVVVLLNTVFCLNVFGQSKAQLARAKEALDRGIAYCNQGDSDRGIAEFTQAINLDPNYAEAYRNRAWAYTLRGNTGDKPKASADIDMASKLGYDD